MNADAPDLQVFHVLATNNDFAQRLARVGPLNRRALDILWLRHKEPSLWSLLRSAGVFSYRIQASMLDTQGIGGE